MLIPISAFVMGAFPVASAMPGARRTGGGLMRVAGLRRTLGVIRAADADRREGRAVGADRPAALRAGEPGLAIGMPVAVTRLDRRHPG